MMDECKTQKGCKVRAEVDASRALPIQHDVVRKLKAEVRKLNRQLSTAYGYGCDGGQPPWI